MMSFKTFGMARLACGLVRYGMFFPVFAYCIGFRLSASTSTST